MAKRCLGTVDCKCGGRVCSFADDTPKERKPAIPERYIRPPVGRKANRPSFSKHRNR